MEASDSALGARSEDTCTTWIVECPVMDGCFTNLNSATAELLGEEKESVSAEMVSPDTMMVDLRGGLPKLAVAAAPSLAARRLGYAERSRFYEQGPPLSALPAFPASTCRQAAAGTDPRAGTLRPALTI